MFNFRIINTPNGNQIIDRNLSTPYESLTPTQMVEYTEIDNQLHHYIQGNIDSGIIGHRSDCPDYEDIEEVGKDKDGNIELSICVMD